MNLWAISDLHVGYEENRRAVERLGHMGDDWLIIAGDTGESPAHLDHVLRALRPHFAQIIWTPGNHDLWTPQTLAADQRGEAHYRRLVRLCRSYDVLTPEDPYAIWPGAAPRTAIVPSFILYDYSFRPDHVAAERAVAWAAEAGVRCADEALLDPSPFHTRAAWCGVRVEETESRLRQIPAGTRLILVNHWPLHREHAVLPRIPRFSPWCGTRATEHWLTTFAVDTVVFGHLHLRSTRARGGVRFEEVSLGYPHQWDPRKGLRHYLRLIRSDAA
jgi:3',5'-cyclic AMP phosphodiesterase CpdA